MLDDPHHLRIERLLPAPVEEVFAAWTNPELMALWLSPVGHAEVQNDLSVAGRFRVLMVGDDMRIEHTGEYLEIQPPHRLAFTWNSPYTGNEPSVVTVELASEADQTRLVLVHERLPKSQVDPHAGGWGTMLDRLTELLRSEIQHNSPESEEVSS
jgi:uncharacterized protein YndB with AHSA1/START domain